MTYFADLTPYVYDVPDRSRLNVGWLDAEHAYHTGVVDDDLRLALVHLLRFQVNETRGAHACPLCGERVVRFMDDGSTALLGAAEIYVDGDDGSAFAAPSLIVHYVLEHGYRPPDPFCKAAVEFARFYGLPPSSHAAE